MSRHRGTWQHKMGDAARAFASVQLALHDQLTPALTRAARKLSWQLETIRWHQSHGPITDLERYGLRLTRRYLREGRPDLAVETLDWLARRLEREALRLS